MRVSNWFIFLSVVLCASHAGAKAVLSATSRSLPQKQNTSVVVNPEKKMVVTAYPSTLFQCEVTEDCLAVQRDCREWFAVRREHAPFFQFSSEAVKSSNQCDQTVPQDLGAVACQKNICEFSSRIGRNARSADAWKERCAAKNLEGLIDSLNGPLKTLVLQLHSPLGWERQSAVKVLGQMKKGAAPAIPWLLEEIKNKESRQQSDEALCLLGPGATEDTVARTIGLIDPEGHPAVRLYAEWLLDETLAYRHAEILQQLYQMGPEAKVARESVGEILRRSAKKGMMSDLGLLAIETLASMGSEAADQLPLLREKLEETKSIKVRIFMAMIKIDPKDQVTQEAASHLWGQNEDMNARTMALHFLAGFPEKMEQNLDLLKSILRSSEMTSYRLGALRAVERLGKKGTALIPEVVRIGLEGQDDLRRQAALVLKAIDPKGKKSMALLKARVYKGYPSEAQYLWKIIDSPLTRLELLKSHYYLVTGQRVKFKDLRLPASHEGKLLRCLENSDCSQPHAAIAALVLSQNNSERFADLLIRAMGSDDFSLRGEASGAFLLLFSKQSPANINAETASQALARAWSLQDEALQQSGVQRHIDLEDLLMASVVPDHQYAQKILSRFTGGNSVEALDSTLLLVSKDSEAARQIVQQSLRGTNRETILAILRRMTLSRAPDAQWFKEQIKTLVNHKEPLVQEAAVIDQMSLKSE